MRRIPAWPLIAAFAWIAGSAIGLGAVAFYAQPQSAIPPRPADFAHERYEAIVVDVHDGDTFRVVPRHVRSIRIAGIDAPEVRDNPHGKADPVPAEASRKALRSLLGSGRVLVAETGESFGRRVGKVYVQAPDGKILDVAAEMVRLGNAVPYEPPR